MTRIIEVIRNNPAVVVGVIFSAALAAIQSLAGNEVISPDLAASVGKALDPQSGWALPIVVGLITRLFVSKADHVGW